jgi:ribosomal protein S14
MSEARRECKRCGEHRGVTPSGHLRAHACPHGRPCVLSYAARKRGQRARRCAPCLAGRQLELFAAAGAVHRLGDEP